MLVQVKARFLGVVRIVKKGSGDVFHQVHLYDGTQRLVTPFIDAEDLKVFNEFEFGQEILLDMEIWQGKNGMGQRILEVVNG